AATCPRVEIYGIFRITFPVGSSVAVDVEPATDSGAVSHGGCQRGRTDVAGHITADYRGCRTRLFSLTLCNVGSTIPGSCRCADWLVNHSGFWYSISGLCVSNLCVLCQGHRQNGDRAECVGENQT